MKAQSKANNKNSDNGSILGQDTHLEGKLTFDGVLRIDGRFTGEIKSGGTLHIGEHADVTANIDVDVLIMHGRVKGDVQAQKRLELHSPAKLLGNIVTEVIVIREGVTIDGNIKVNRTEIGLDSGH